MFYIYKTAAHSLCFVYTPLHVAGTTRAREEMRLSPHVPVGLRRLYSVLESVMNVCIELNVLRPPVLMQAVEYGESKAF